MMLVIPDGAGCTIVANGKCCAYSGSVDAIVKECFVEETPIDGGATLIAPKVKEVEVLMNSITGAIFCEAFKENNIKVVEVAYGTHKQVFATKRLE
ncbi:MAG: hypothetical protein NC548_48975 [Lachnospiraceae bacterium]|nr:hypothetical protein [Lachnospiraceae bacterium]